MSELGASVQPIAHWDIDQLRVIDEFSFAASVPPPGDGSVTIAFWFQAADTARTQVIANLGCRDEAESGCEIWLDDGQLHFRVRDGAGCAAEVMLACASSSEWRHVTCIIDRERNRLESYLQTTDEDEPIATASVALACGPIQTSADLNIGGYTDPAGGHFDHTFGRQRGGTLDDFRIYTRALSRAEIAAFRPADARPPIAEIKLSSNVDRAPCVLRFDGRDSHADDGQIRAYWWDFGDGYADYGALVEHEYRYAGDYPVRLTVLSDQHVEASVEQRLTLAGPENPLRSRPVFVNGTEGHACYRIPSIVRAATGDLVAFAEGRLHTCSDSGQPIRIVCKRSSDNGRTWTPVQIVAQDVIAGQEYTVQNCSPVVDTVHGTGRIVLVMTAAEHSEWDLARGTGTSRAWCVVSDDHGQTWSPPRDITAQVHRPAVMNAESDWRIQRPALGHAIQLQSGTHRGRLFHAGTITCGDRSVFNSQNYVFWSADLGQTWQIGGVAPQPGLNEASAVELQDGAVMINSRSYHDEQPTGRRAVTLAEFDDSGAALFGETRYDAALIDSAVQASILRYTWRHDLQDASKSRIVFANPSHPRARKRMTVRLSEDEGQTWAFSKVVDPGPAAYSDLVVQADGQIGLLYERGNQGGIWYVSFTLDWLTDGQDSLRHQEGTC
ncbi:MAG: exo-alpha-sialidase [Anaerolineae bacterium]|nr:exo-alpha-sialidase [Anaerolineae bacterium]